jgi:hypothetical protein
LGSSAKDQNILTAKTTSEKIFSQKVRWDENFVDQSAVSQEDEVNI